MSTASDMTIIDYAAEHGLDPADMATVIEGDPEPVQPTGADALGRTISTRSSVYANDRYPVDYLSLVARSCREMD